MRNARLAVLTAVSCGLMFAQSEAPPLSGWTTVQWGMSEDQVLEKYPNAQREMLYSTRVLTLHGFRIEPSQYSVLFGFENGRLIMVRLTSEKSAAPNVTAQIAKDTLLDGLRNKYGKEASAEETPRDHDVTRRWKWLFPQTTIDLFWIASPGPEYRQLDLTYVQYSERKSNDKL